MRQTKFQSIIRIAGYLSDANLVLVDVSPHQLDAVFDFLARRGVIVQDCLPFCGAEDSLVRVSVGAAEWNGQVVEAFSEFLEG